jgi:mono/diheme cytochrome c family protein
MTTTHITSVLRRCALIATLLLAGGCSDRKSQPEAAQLPAEETSASEAAAVTPAGEINAEMARRGESLFQSEGCNGCHTVGGGRLTGPDLQGVTERRSLDWFVAMVIDPDSMLREDPAARELFAEYMTPMMNIGATADEAASLYEYLRRESQ